jgi:hypothetical protein
VARTRPPRGSAGARQLIAAMLITIVIGGGVLAGLSVSGLLDSHPLAPGPVAAATSAPSDVPSASAGSPATPDASAGAGPSAGPGATPGTSGPPPVVLVPAPLTGLLVSPTAARQHPIAVMIDDHPAAIPQSGFNSAAIVWQAPAEGGVPRYMLIFQDKIAGTIGPVRSARQYFIEWAAEWRAMYVHAGGSPGALATLRQSGNGSLVWNAEDFRWEGRYLWRIKTRFAPHNVYTDGKHLRALAVVLKVPDGPIRPNWTFRWQSIETDRPATGTVTVVYLQGSSEYERITYRYDPLTNRYLRFINGSKRPQVDVANGKVVAPTNVVILRMHFGLLGGPHPEKGRLEASDVGTGPAWISTGGITIKGTWSKASKGAPTRLFGPDGRPVVLNAGQTFVQVMPYGYPVLVADGSTGGSMPGLSEGGFAAS